MEYDIVVPIGPSHVQIGSRCVKHICRHLSFRCLWILTSKANRPFLNVLRSDNVEILDEDSVVPAVTFASLKAILAKRNADDRTGWYLQQFLKMVICSWDTIANFYLVWDSDTILLRPMSFFSEVGKILLQTVGTIDARDKFYE